MKTTIREGVLRVEEGLGRHSLLLDELNHACVNGGNRHEEGQRRVAVFVLGEGVP